MDIFEYENYKKYVQDRVKNLPKRGHGYFTKMATHLSVTTVLVSQIFRGGRDLTLEQAQSLGEFFGFTELELDYFVNLVQRDRAGTQPLKAYFNKKIKELQLRARNLSEVIGQHSTMNEGARAEFYSQWYYMAIWMATSMREFYSPEEFSQYLKLDIGTVNRVLYFLLQHGVVVKTEKGFQPGQTLIHIEATSPHVARHHTNWRLQALTKMDRIKPQELCFTMPCTLSETDFDFIRKELLSFIKHTTERVTKSPSETMAFMNIDWLFFKPRS